MDGVPVYLASLSRRTPGTGRIVPTGKWSPAWRERGAQLLRRAVAGLGDPTRERLFRMNATLCLHRALTDAELAVLPPWFHAAPAVDIAGGPVEILAETVPGRASTRPCERPARIPLDPRDPDLWIPRDCGACPPCLGRLA